MLDIVKENLKNFVISGVRYLRNVCLVNMDEGACLKVTDGYTSQSHS